MSDEEKEQLLQEYIEAHENETCDCDGNTMDLCIGGMYINGLISKDELFNEWWA